MNIDIPMPLWNNQQEWDDYMDASIWEVDSVEKTINNWAKKINSILLLDDLKINIDKNNTRIDLFDWNTLIWEIYRWVYHVWDEVINDHLWIEVNDKYREMGAWRYLYTLYKQEFWIPELEYSRSRLKIEFLASMWYSPEYIVNEETMEEEQWSWNFEDFDKIENWLYTCKLILE